MATSPIVITPKPGDPPLVLRNPPFVLGHVPRPFIVNVTGNVIAGQQVYVGVPDNYPVRLTVNLSHHAVADFYELAAVGTYNMSGDSNLTLGLITGAHAENGSAIVNMIGDNTLKLFSYNSHAVINLAPGARWDGTMTTGFAYSPIEGSTTVNGGPGSRWDNNGATSITDQNAVKVNVPVTGIGSFSLITNYILDHPATMEFASSVGPHQTIMDAGLLVIDKPTQFLASVVLTDTPNQITATTGAYPEIDLNGLANADSYSFKNSMLSFYSGNRVIDQLHLTNQVLTAQQHTAPLFVDKMPTTGMIRIIGIANDFHVGTLVDNGLPVHA